MKLALRGLIAAVAALATALFPDGVRAAAGDLYEADSLSDTIFKFTPTASKSTFAAGLNAPKGLAFDSFGNLFEADNGSLTIFKFSADGTKTTFAAGLSDPESLIFDSASNLFEVDFGSGTIFKFTPDATKSTFATGLSKPRGLAFDHTGNLFATDQFSGTIFKFTPDGTKSTFAAGLNGPYGLAFDSFGNLFEADNASGTIFKFTPDGTKSTFAAGLNGPTGLAFDSFGNLFEADNASGTIFKFTPDGTKSTFAAGLNGPYALAFEPTTTPGVQLSNVSTRGLVQTGDQVLIGGFIISGTAPKPVLIRAIGPTLANFGVAGPLQDPVLSLHDITAEIANNDNWQSAPNAGQIPINLQPGDPRESAILITLQPGSYTAIVSGKDGTTGVALVEVYDFDPLGASHLVNVSTRGFVQTGDNVMIGGFVSAGAGTITVLVRAIGPSLAQFGIAGVLADPTLRLIDGNGATIDFNDNWKDTQQALIEATGKAPINDLEAAILATLPPGPFTAIVSGKNGGSGIGLVDVFKQ